MSGVATMPADGGTSVWSPAEREGLGDRLPVTLKPHPNLLRYYLLSSLVLGPAFFLAALPYYFRYRTLRYEMDAEGITMRWGILFRREISLTYARIQDIQLSSNVIERWLGLARIQLQTASGSAAAEMTIEGLRDPDAMRDFLYSRMRGAADVPAAATPGHALAAAPPKAVANAPELAALTAALEGATAELRLLREQVSDSQRGRHG
jgi:putative membrane protein